MRAKMGLLWSWLGRRRWLALAVAVVGGATLALTILPDVGLRWGLIRTLRDFGMAEISVTDADLQLFDGRIVVRRMLARPLAGTALGLEGLDVVINWRPLLDHRVAVDALALDGLSIDIRREGGRLVVSGLPVLLSGASSGDPWRYNVESLRLAASHITFADGATHLDIAVDELEVGPLRSWEPATPVHIRLKGRLDGAALVVSGTVTPFAATPDMHLTIAAENLDMGHFGRTELAGRLTTKGTVNGTLPGPIDVDGDIAVVNAALVAAGSAVKAASLEWHGHLSVGPTFAAAGKLAARKLSVVQGDNTLSAEAADITADQAHAKDGRGEFVGTLAAETLHLRAGSDEGQVVHLTAAATALTFDAAHQRVDWQGQLTAEAVRVLVDGFHVEPEKLGWQGQVAMVDGTAHVRGRLDSEGARLALGDLQIDHRRAIADGTLDVGGGKITAALAIEAEGLALHDSGGSRDLAAFEHLQATDLRLNPGKPVTIAQLDATNATALQARGKPAYPWRAEARRLRLDRAAIGSTGDVSAETLAVDGLILRLTRTRSGFVGLTSGGAGAASGPGPRVALGRLSIGAKSRLAFEDRTLGQTVKLDVADVQLSASGLDSARPDRDSPFDVKARIGTATLAASGAARPFAAAITARLQGNVKALELPPLSPYAADSLGVDFQTGHFDGDVQVKLDSGALEGKVDLTLSNLFVAQPNANSALARHADMPVATVLDLLRDGDDRIHLAIPLSGDLADPRFDVSDAVAQAIGGALRSTALTTLKVVFPVAALIEMAVEGGESALALDPLPFAAGDDAIGEAQTRRLATVAELLRQRPALHISLCGSSSIEADWPVVLERRKRDELGVLYKIQKLMDVQAKPATTAPDMDSLGQLAERRAEAVKAKLADAGIDAGRLFSCRAEVEAKGAPRVSLKL
jgi:Domain of Unknown Function (DUF748)